MSSPRFLAVLATTLALVVAQTAFAAPGLAANRLQQQQLQDNLDLNLQQSTPGRPASMSPSDAQQLDQLQLSQRMQQQQLEQQQLVQQQQQLRLQRIDPAMGPRNALQQQQFAAERQLQLQQFNTQQQQLMNTIKPQPLQPPMSSAGLVPPMSPGLLPQP